MKCCPCNCHFPVCYMPSVCASLPCVPSFIVFSSWICLLQQNITDGVMGEGGFRFPSLFDTHLWFCSSCFYLIMLPLLSLHDLFSSVSLSGLITTECLQCKRQETNGKQIQSTHCLINQVVWCSSKPPLPDNIQSPCVFCTRECADGKTVMWV